MPEPRNRKELACGYQEANGKRNQGEAKPPTHRAEEDGQPTDTQTNHQRPKVLVDGKDIDLI